MSAQKALFASFALLLLAAAVAFAASDRCMPFVDITSVTFAPGMTATRRRGPNVPRLHCVGGCADAVVVTGAQCRQTGVGDNGLPSWRCDATFADAAHEEVYRLGHVTISCEGCERRGDPNVVHGSCQLRYHLEHFTGQHGRTIDDRTPTHAVRVPFDDGYQSGSLRDTLVTIVVVTVGVFLLMWGCSRVHGPATDCPDNRFYGDESPRYGYGHRFQRWWGRPHWWGQTEATGGSWTQWAFPFAAGWWVGQQTAPSSASRSTLGRSTASPALHATAASHQSWTSRGGHGTSEST